MKKSAITLAIVASAMLANAQNYNGVILDSENQPLPYANIVLQSLPDSTFICGTVSDIDGKFSITCNKKADLLRVSSIGYQTMYINAPQDNIGTLKLQSTDSELGEIVVKAQMPKTKLQGTAMVTSIEGSALSNAGSCNDILSKIPGIIEGKDGFEVIGKGAPLFYINGREVRDLDELKRINSDEIKDIEVIMTPGVEYPSGVTSVVKIHTKRRQGEGFGFDTEMKENAEIRHGASNPSANVNINYRHNNLDIFGGVTYWRWHNYSESTPEQYTYVSDIIHQNSKMITDWRGDGLNYRIGANYQVSDNHSFGVRMEFNDKFQNDFLSNIETEMDINGIIADRMFTNEDQEDKEKANYRSNIYYTGKIGKLNIEYNGDVYQKKNESFDKQFETSSLADKEITTYNITDNLCIANKMVLNYPVSKGNIKLGSEITNISRDNEYIITLDNIPNTKSSVKENMTAVFAEYGFSFSQYANGSVGVRYEHTNYDFDDLSGNLDKDYKQDNIFPQLTFSSALGKVQVSLNYTAKTKRPSYWQLNDAISYINRYTLQGGNSHLKNAIEQELGLNLHYNVLNLNATMAHVKNFSTEWTFPYEDGDKDNTQGVVIIREINISKPLKVMNVFFNASPTFGCYSMNYTAGILKPWLNINVDDPRESLGNRNLTLNKPLGILSLNNTLKFKNSWQFELGYYAQTKGNSGNVRLNNYIDNLSCSIQKSFLKDNLTIRFAGQQLTRNWKQNITMDCGYYVLNQSHENFGGRVELSVRYKFNSANNKYKGTSAGDDAINRM